MQKNPSKASTVGLEVPNYAVCMVGIRFFGAGMVEYALVHAVLQLFVCFFFFGQGSQGGVWPLYISTIIQLFIASELKHSFLKREGPEAHMT